MARTDAYQVTVDHEFYKTYTEDNYVTIGDPTRDHRAEAVRQSTLESSSSGPGAKTDFLIVDDLFGANSQPLRRLCGVIQESLCPITIPRVRGGAA